MKTLLQFCLLFLLFAADLPAQVTQLNNNNSLKVTFPLANNKTIVVSDTDSSIWVTDATQAGTVQISTDIKFEESGGLISGKLVFRGSVDSTGSEIFVTDGTPGGTVLVKDIDSGATSSNPDDMAQLNGFIYFTAVTAGAGRELWRTDGTEGGTILVKDIFPGPTGSNTDGNYNLFSNGSYLLFAAQADSTSGIELWKSDGTGAGTGLLKDINLNPVADSSSSDPNNFFKYNNLVLFTASDTAHGEEIWKTDGTPSGTMMIKDIDTGSVSSTSEQIILAPGFPPFSRQLFFGFHLFNNKAYFNATDGHSSGQIWSTDGTDANTVLLKNVVQGAYPDIPVIALFDAVNLPAKFIFPISDGQDHFQLWESDGTTAGTKVFSTFSNELPSILLPYSIDFTNQTLAQQLFQGNKFFFLGTSAANGRELWVTDGVDSTPAHTHMVKDIYPNTGDGITAAFTTYVYTTAGLYFAATDSTNGNELWKSDGTDSGTAMVADINPGTENADPELPLFVANGKIIFSATDGDDADNTDLYVVDGNFIPLPVKLSEFTVALKASDAVLQWSTLNEINTDGFTVQRSYDGQHFENIANVPASSGNSAKHTYSFTDLGVGNSGKTIIYYRILASDKDGKSETTNIIFVKLKGISGWSVTLLSNPVQSYANLVLNNITKNVKLSISDLNGKILYTESRQNINGQISIPVANLARGTYILVTETNNERKSIKFIKQ